MKEKEEEDTEKREKERKKLENKEFFKYVNDKSKEYKEEEKMIEKLVAAE